MSDHIPHTLVLGGSGKTGRRVVERLTARNLPVRIGSRGAGVPFDWEVPATWAPALQNVNSVYVSYYPDLAAPGAVDTIAEFAELAVSTGARRLVLLSGRGEEEAQASEKALANSGADWTVVRASWFDQNFSEGYLVDAVQAGEVVLPAGNVPEPFIDVEDIADIATVALTEEGHVGEMYEVTGPRLLTFAEAVATISEATGRDIAFQQVSVADNAAFLTEMGLPTDVVDLLTYLFDTVLDGRNSYVSDGVERALGRSPRDFADFARTAATTGIWNQE